MKFTEAKAGLPSSRKFGLAEKEITSFGRKSSTTNGPVPIGPKFASVQVGALAPVQSANWAFWMTGDSDPTKAV